MKGDEQFIDESDSADCEVLQIIVRFIIGVAAVLCLYAVFG